MITDEVTIYNMALNAVGTRSNVSAPTETSREAEVCKRWFGTVRDQVLRAAPWPSTKKFARLALIKERNDQLPWDLTDPEPGFQFVYGMPDDALNPRFLVNYERFTVMPLSGGLALNCNVPEAVLCYTFRQENIGLWDAQLQMAIVYGLAAYISMPLHGKTQRTNLMIQQANDLIMQAREASGNTDENQITTIPDWIAARGYATPVADTRFYYPNGGLLQTGMMGV